MQRIGTSTNNALNWTICQPGDPAPCPNTDPHRNQTRVLQTTGGFAFDGSLLYYTITGFIVPNTFTSASAGDDARSIANRRMAFIFPIRRSDGTYIPSPALSNRRQDNLFDYQRRLSRSGSLGTVDSGIRLQATGFPECSTDAPLNV